MNTILKVENIEKVYGNKGNVTHALKNISFEVQKGDFIAIMGPSGSGKSTLLNCISTIDTATAGHVFIDGEDVTKLKGHKLSKFRSEKLGFIFQEYNLLDTLTAFENVSLALSIINYPVNEIEHEVDRVAAALDIKEVLYKYPYQMSGGQQQRIAAARAIVTRPTLLLADEPTGALDSKSAKMLLKNLEILNQQQDATTLMVTHDPYNASYCRRIIFLKDGEIFNELIRGKDDRKTFFNRIMEVVALLGGNINDEF
ncbi:ABC transporter ATP-binding protein [Lysinibacillus sp. HST-98]|uniref:ABC transporter ATP-binding protein n=1 Tax=Lysinibacillus capsici TaxID=2115968 RepID=A0ABY8KDQ6_9BACI|nr:MULTISPECIES: ABC transporter ATP-binding protein [Lysinibacillus]EKU41552.1 ABC transporter related protein [Lysinibacillus fusiformis ZB2]MBL3731936.1 ABC transporter ATP-binding protein [Lysinibacillus sp. HST-98]MBX8945035.1 ABC transporter ATP-binding protein [Lysinibacillus sp. K60]MED4700706.1 ABC transporter ATP-binding protein [Lysinibacillus capsici]WGF37265.1 ABC transporter ATP-binding protein [Lysinibacillus capsici]